MKNRNGGFTFEDVLITIAIIAIVSAIFMGGCECSRNELTKLSLSSKDILELNYHI